MNKKQKIILKIWKRYSRKCKNDNCRTLVNYKMFKKVYSAEKFENVLLIKEWYKELEN